MAFAVDKLFPGCPQSGKMSGKIFFQCRGILTSDVQTGLRIAIDVKKIGSGLYDN